MARWGLESANLDTKSDEYRARLLLKKLQLALDALDAPYWSSMVEMEVDAKVRSEATLIPDS